MNAPSSPTPPPLGPVDLSESVAGEEDPGASLDMPTATPVMPAIGADPCTRCDGSGKIASGTCPDCRGSGKRAVGTKAA